MKLKESVRKRDTKTWIVLIMASFIVIGTYSFFDPADTWWMPKCPVHFLTGLECPGCGSQRAVHALLHGEFREALSHNALLVVLLPFLAVMGYGEVTRNRNPRFYRYISNLWTILSIIALVLIWSIIRNLSFFE